MPEDSSRSVRESKVEKLTVVAGRLTSAPHQFINSLTDKEHTHTHTGDTDSLTNKHPSSSHFLTYTATLELYTNKQIYTDLRTLARTPTPPGQGPMGVCTEIGHLSHMMSRGRGCIIDEPKQHVSVSTHHTARHRRKQQEVGREG